MDPAEAFKSNEKKLADEISQCFFPVFLYSLPRCLFAKYDELPGRYKARVLPPSDGRANY